MESYLKFNNKSTGVVIFYKKNKQTIEYTTKNEAIFALTCLTIERKISFEDYSRNETELLNRKTLPWEDPAQDNATQILVGIIVRATAIGMLQDGDLEFPRLPSMSLLNNGKPSVRITTYSGTSPDLDTKPGALAWLTAHQREIPATLYTTMETKIKFSKLSEH